MQLIVASFTSWFVGRLSTSFCVFTIIEYFENHKNHNCWIFCDVTWLSLFITHFGEDLNFSYRPDKFNEYDRWSVFKNFKMHAGPHTHVHRRKTIFYSILKWLNLHSFRNSKQISIKIFTFLPNSTDKSAVIIAMLRIKRFLCSKKH